MSRPNLPHRPFLIVLCGLIAALVAPVAARAQTPPPPGASKEQVLAYWADVMKAATARIQVLDDAGAPLRETFGVVLGTPPRLVARSTALAGAASLKAEFPRGETATSVSLHAHDPFNDIAVLETTGALPPPPEPDDKIQWRYREVCYVIPAPGMDPAWPRETIAGPTKLDRIEFAPLSGDHPGGLPVMYPSGWWIGLTGRIEDGADRFVYLTPMGAILPTLFQPGDPAGFDEAAEAAARLLSPDSVEGLLARAVIRSFADDAAAEALFNRALEIDPAVPALQFEYGRSLFRQQRYEEAERAFQESFRLRPAWTDAYQMAGAAANQQGEYQKALEYYRRGLEIDPESTTILINQWGALFNLGRMEEAIGSLEKILARDPDHELAIYNLGTTHLRSGRKAEAEEQQRRLAALGSRYAQMLREQIDKGS